MQKHQEVKHQQNLRTENKQVKIYQYGNLTFYVSSNKPSQKAIENFNRAFNDLFEKTLSIKETP